eukprot:m.120716 g.120716  ORF g.120716 m.120716 type:complete len:119 (+) comp15503_c0_seq4:264-620(+)
MLRVLSKIIHPAVDDEGFVNLQSDSFGFRQAWTTSDRLWQLVSQLEETLTTVTLEAIAMHLFQNDSTDAQLRAKHEITECIREADFHTFSRDDDDHAVRYSCINLQFHRHFNCACSFE